MIAYDIICGNTHKFEGWFKSHEDFLSQRESGLLECPMCGSKALEQMSAPAIRTKKYDGDPLQTDLRDLASRVVDYIGRNFEDVGDNFAEEAKRIHYQETEARNIRGTASGEEVTSLRDEGIECFSIPLPKLDS